MAQMNAQVPLEKKGLGAADFPGVAKETLVSKFGPGTLELVAHHPVDKKGIGPSHLGVFAGAQVIA